MVRSSSQVLLLVPVQEQYHTYMVPPLVPSLAAVLCIPMGTAADIGSPRSYTQLVHSLLGSHAVNSRPPSPFPPCCPPTSPGARKGWPPGGRAIRTAGIHRPVGQKHCQVRAGAGGAGQPGVRCGGAGQYEQDLDIQELRVCTYEPAALLSSTAHTLAGIPANSTEHP